MTVFAKLRYLMMGSVLTLLVVVIFGKVDANGLATSLTATPIPCEDEIIPSPDSIEALKADLREANGVRQLEPLENDLPLHALPNGVYGFTVPWIINTDSTGVVGGTGADRISLNRSSFGTLQMEVHKAADGSVYIVGFVSSQDYENFISAKEGEKLTFTLLFKPYLDSNIPLAVPLDSIIFSDNRTIETNTDHFYANDLQVVKNP